MAYRKKDLEKLALTAIRKYKLTKVSQVATFLPCSRSTFYAKKLDKLDTIKEALNDSKISIKSQLMKKWFDSGSGVTQIALFKLLADEDELTRLTGVKQEHTFKGDGVLEELNKLSQVPKSKRAHLVKQLEALLKDAG